MEKVEGQSAQDQNVGRKHQKGVELPWSIPLSGAGEALCISTTHEDADIIDQQEVRHVLEPVEEINEDALRNIRNSKPRKTPVSPGPVYFAI